MNTLNLRKYKFTLSFVTDAFLPPFIGNTIRGALGQALYDNSREAYNAIFKGAGTESKPNPFSISAPYPSKGKYYAGEILEFYVTLFGIAGDCGEEIPKAVQTMCKGKLEHTRLTEIECIYAREWSDSGAESIPHCDNLTVSFLSPTEILSSKKPLHEIGFNTFTDSLFGRINGIINNYTRNEFVLSYTLIAERPLVTAEYDLKPVDIQTSGQPIRGFIGQIRYFGDITRYLPYIDLGSQIHIGKKTTRSCGEYSIEI